MYRAVPIFRDPQPTVGERVPHVIRIEAEVHLAAGMIHGMLWKYLNCTMYLELVHTIYHLIIFTNTFI